MIPPPKPSAISALGIDDRLQHRLRRLAGDRLVEVRPDRSPAIRRPRRCGSCRSRSSRTAPRHRCRRSHSKAPRPALRRGPPRRAPSPRKAPPAPPVDRRRLGVASCALGRRRVLLGDVSELGAAVLLLLAGGEDGAAQAVITTSATIPKPPSTVPREGGKFSLRMPMNEMPSATTQSAPPTM